MSSMPAMPPMLASSTAPLAEVVVPDISAIVTEDDAPLDNFPSEKQQRLLTESLYSSWPGPPPAPEGERRSFLAAANVGLFATPKEPPLVPDVLLSLDVELHEAWWQKEHRSYFLWEFGKPPDVVIEVVSNREGDELGLKRRRYAWMRVAYYVVWDPAGHLGGPALRAFEMRGHTYVPMDRAWFEAAGLGLCPWEGVYEGRHDRWLRWHTADGGVVPTGAERAEREQARAEREQARAEREQARAERLAAQLRALGVEPDDSGS
ncbi:Uma2 family endonuclease [Sorangium sp. So ce1389]|uniref:Uma2 family endonuclease n=1 Tax=Sorangium sp. So ce1389 TaxID=3133336 RepID=UPI003F607B70